MWSKNERKSGRGGNGAWGGKERGGILQEKRYRILKKLAEGGSGETYLVWDVRLEQEWVMKCVPLCRDEGIESAQREICALRTLRKEVIPVLIDAFYEEEKICLVMEYVKGISLEEKIRQEGAMPEREAVDCALQLAFLLQELHSLPGRLVHGDLKPLNAIWNQGKVALLDFGAAVFQYRGKREEVFYTPGYGAPELMQGCTASVESDVYALGAVLFYLVTGKTPGAGRQIGPVREENPALTKELEQFLLKCTENVPARRYHSMEEVIGKLAVLAEKRGRTGRNRKTFQTIQNILLTDGKSFPFVLNCLEGEESKKQKRRKNHAS